MTSIIHIVTDVHTPDHKELKSGYSEYVKAFGTSAFGFGLIFEDRKQF